MASLLVGTVDSIVSRRRAIAAMSAVGIPASVVRRAVLVESLLPLATTIPLAAAAGILAARGIMTTRVYLTDFDQVTQQLLTTVVVIRVPWGPLTVIVTGAVTAATVAATPLMRASADPAELRAA